MFESHWKNHLQTALKRKYPITVILKGNNEPFENWTVTEIIYTLVTLQSEQGRRLYVDMQEIAALVFPPKLESVK